MWESAVAWIVCVVRKPTKMAPLGSQNRVEPASEQLHSCESNSQSKPPYARSLRRQHTAFLPVNLTVPLKSGFAPTHLLIRQGLDRRRVHAAGHMSGCEGYRILRNNRLSRGRVGSDKDVLAALNVKDGELLEHVKLKGILARHKGDLREGGG